MSFRPANAADHDVDTSRPETAGSLSSSPHSPTGSPVIKRKEASPQSGRKTAKKVKKNAAKTGGDAKDASPAKSKRVRTGCLTCRERHLKCDEGVPDCANCIKSNRDCKRGIKLNFIDIWVEPVEYALAEGSRLEFHDESRIIAAEYQGGNERYQQLHPDRTSGSRRQQSDYVSAAGDLATGASRRHSAMGSLPSSHGAPAWPSHSPNHTSRAHQFPQPTPPLRHNNSDPRSILSSDSYRQQSTSQSSQQSSQPSQSAESGVSSNLHGPASIRALSNSTTLSETEVPHSVRPATSRTQSISHISVNRVPSPPRQEAQFASYIEGIEGLYLDAFEDVTMWLDALDTVNEPFKKLTPIKSRECPMMREAMLACGARHLNFKNPAEHPESTVLHHYGQALRRLLVDMNRGNNGITSNSSGGLLSHHAPIDHRRHSTSSPRVTEDQAITAVLLNVYDVMSAHSSRTDVTASSGTADSTATPAVHPGHQRTAYEASARHLIEQVGWNARTPGIGGACFWNNIGFEVLSCLHFNISITRKPEIWGLVEPQHGIVSHSDARGRPQSAGEGGEEIWPYTTQSSTARIVRGPANIPFLDWSKDEGDERPGLECLWARRQLFLLAKLNDYRVDFVQNLHILRDRPDFPGSSFEWSRMASRLSRRWQKLWDLNELWCQNRPRTMAPTWTIRVQDLRPAPNTMRSNFPQTKYAGRTATVAALFHQMAKLLLSQHNPAVVVNEGTAEGERLLNAMDQEETNSALMICSITAHTRDAGVASIAIQPLHHAAETLGDPAKQNEVLAIFDRISRTIGWRIDNIITELMQLWQMTPSQPTLPMPTTRTPMIPITSALADLSMTLPPLQQRDRNSPRSLGGPPLAFFKLPR